MRSSKILRWNIYLKHSIKKYTLQLLEFVFGSYDVTVLTFKSSANSNSRLQKDDKKEEE